MPRTRRSLNSTFASSDSTRSDSACSSRRRPRHLGHEPLDDFVVQRVPLRLPAVALGVALRRFDVELRLNVQRADQRVRVEEQLQQRIQQPPDEAHQPAMRVVDRRVLERECRLVGDLLGRSLRLGAGASPSASSSDGLIARGSRIDSRRRAARSWICWFESSMPWRWAIRPRMSRMICSTSTWLRSGRAPAAAAAATGDRGRADRIRAGRDGNGRRRCP